MLRRHLPRARLRHRLLAWVALAAALPAVVSCSRPDSRELQPGSYRATVELPGGKLVPFGLDVAREEKGLVLYLLNGDERVRIDEVQAGKGRFTARVPGYETTFDAAVRGGELRGEVLLVEAGGRPRRLPFEARLGETWRFFAEALPNNADFAGRWQLTLTDAAGGRSEAVALLGQEFERVTGTVLTPAGDERYLAGEAHDEELRLSRFDGGGVVLYEGTLDAEGRLNGRAWSVTGDERRFTATRNPDASIDANALATRLRDPAAGLVFAFRDPDGRVVASTDPRFAGKVLLLTLAGSWCPNSHDEAALLSALQRQYRSRGLEVVSLMFEHHAGFEPAAAAVRRFRAAHAIEYPTLVAGVSDKASASAALPQLDAVTAFPTAIFIDRNGRVHRIHTGFAGPAAGLAHELLVQDFTATLDELLAEGGPATTAPAP
jgi:hypothetical protein